MARHASELAVWTDTAGAACLLTVDGILDSTNYLELRDAIIKAALDEPPAVIVDVSALQVPTPSAWSVFTSARWHVSTWPDVPIVLVCGHAAGRQAIRSNGVARYVPVYPTAEAALATVGDTCRRGRRLVREELPASLASLRRARELAAESLAAWSQSKLIPVAVVVINVFVENVLQHTESSPTIRLEYNGESVTVAVRDCSSAPAQRREDPIRGGDRVSGLSIVAAVCRTWGSTPTASGKTVWAVIGPENQL